MESILNILVLGFAGLIAYWWANQGILSALLHLICVLAAGVLAFATWEPMTDLVASIPSMQPYGRGIGLVLPFAVYLFALRMLSDKLAPDNLNFPHWANLGLGGAFGVASAILTVGITLIGVGHLHSSRDLVGVVGSARTSASKGQPDLQVSALWIPVHVEAARFFGMLSQSSFAPTFSSTTLAGEHPNLGQQAFGLHRDTYNRAGRLSRTTAAKNSISIVKAILVPEIALPDGRTMGAYLVDLQLDAGASTEGQGFAISAAQLRLVGTAKSTGDAASGAGSGIAYPIAWAQPNSGGGRTTFMFDDAGHYISSPPGTQALSVTLVYPSDPFPATAPPRFMTAVGLRLPFPQVAQQSTAQEAMSMLLGGADSGVVIPPGTMAINPEDITINDSIAPGNADLNNVGAMDLKDTNYLFQGLGEYEQGGFRGNKGIVVKGVWAPPNTRVVRLNVSRGSGSSIDLWNDRSKVRETAGDTANLAIVDDLGRTYFPIGYIHATATGDRRVTVRLQRDGGYYQLNSFPNLSSSGSDKLYALFTPAVGRKIVAVRLGTEWVSTASLDIVPAH